MMGLKPMNKKEYSLHWEKESSLMESNGIYKKLSEIIPKGDVLEIGCGAGYSTSNILKDRQVLVIENNHYCIDLMRKHLESNNQKIPEIIQADIFELSVDSITTIKNFSPEIIVAWFIGSCPEDVYKHVPDEIEWSQKFKKYRENIEDMLFKEEICTPDIKWVHLACRADVSTQCSIEDIKKANHDDYSTYVFEPNGFQIESIEILDWHREKSKFSYIQAPNPNFVGGEVSSKIISILAKRK